MFIYSIKCVRCILYDVFNPFIVFILCLNQWIDEKSLHWVMCVLFKPSLSSSCLTISGLSIRTLDIMYDHTLCCACNHQIDHQSKGKMDSLPGDCHPELSGCITTLIVRNTEVGGCKLWCSNGHLDRSRWVIADGHFNLPQGFITYTVFYLIKHGSWFCQQR